MALIFHYGRGCANQWNKRLEPGQQATVLAWLSFTTTFVGLRALTHWIRAGQWPGRWRNDVWAASIFTTTTSGIALLASVGCHRPARNREAETPPRGRGRIRVGQRIDRR